MKRRNDLPSGWRQPPETTAEPVPLRRPYLGIPWLDAIPAPPPRPRFTPRSRTAAQEQATTRAPGGMAAPRHAPAAAAATRPAPSPAPGSMAAPRHAPAAAAAAAAAAAGGPTPATPMRSQAPRGTAGPRQAPAPAARPAPSQAPRGTAEPRHAPAAAAAGRPTPATPMRSQTPPRMAGPRQAPAPGPAARPAPSQAPRGTAEPRHAPAAAGRPTPATPGRPPAMGRWRPMRAIIGDELRVPMLWCEFGTCIERYADEGALGEGDLRARAHAAGWRYDAAGRLACPSCVQRQPAFRFGRPGFPSEDRPFA